MPIQVSWGSAQKTYTLFRFESPWTWQEYYQSLDTARALVGDLPYVVNTLVDISECRLFPQNLLSNASSTLKLASREADIIVVVTTSHLIEALLHTLEKLYERRKVRFQIARTLHEGRQILADYDRLRVSPPAPDAASESGSAPAEPPSLPE